MATVLLQLDSTELAEVDRLLEHLVHGNLSQQMQHTSDDLAEAKKMCDEDGNAKRANKMLRQRAKQHGKTTRITRHSLCKQLLLEGLKAQTDKLVNAKTKAIEVNAARVKKI